MTLEQCLYYISKLNRIDLSKIPKGGDICKYVETLYQKEMNLLIALEQEQKAEKASHYDPDRHVVREDWGEFDPWLRYGRVTGEFTWGWSPPNEEGLAYLTVNSKGHELTIVWKYGDRLNGLEEAINRLKEEYPDVNINTDIKSLLDQYNRVGGFLGTDGYYNPRTHEYSFDWGVSDPYMRFGHVYMVGQQGSVSWILQDDGTITLSDGFGHDLRVNISDADSRAEAIANALRAYEEQYGIKLSADEVEKALMGGGGGGGGGGKKKKKKFKTCTCKKSHNVFAGKKKACNKGKSPNVIINGSRACRVGDNGCHCGVRHVYVNNKNLVVGCC